MNPIQLVSLLFTPGCSTATARWRVSCPAFGGVELVWLELRARPIATRLYFWPILLCWTVLAVWSCLPPAAVAETVVLDDDFSTSTNLELDQGNATWSAEETAILQAFRQAGLSYGLRDFNSDYFGAEGSSFYSIATGDVDGDGDLDVVVGDSEASRLYLNNGSAAPFSGVTGTDIGSATGVTNSIALGDVDGDGDLDLVEGNDSQTNKLYMNT